MNTELLITNIGFAIAIILDLALAFLVLIKRPKKGAAANVLFFFFSIAGITWQLSYVLGINIHDSNLSRLAFMFNISSIFIVLLITQLVLVMTDRYKSQKWFLNVLYAVAVLGVVFFAIFPDTFLLASQPRLYLPNFFVPGSLYSLQDMFFTFTLVNFFVQMFLSFKKSDFRMRNRLKYFFIAIIYCFGVSLVPELLLYGIRFDPILACLNGLYIIPMTYAIIKYDAIDISLLAKRAFGYALSIAAVTFFILLIGYMNDAIVAVVPEFPQWPVPLASAVLAVIVGVWAWKKMKETDLLKYQFVDVVTHKFRTPITHIKWSVETLKGHDSSEKEKEAAIQDIDAANAHLYELTDTLIGVSNADESQYLYTFADVGVGSVVDTALQANTDRIKEKRVSVQKNIPDATPDTHIDAKRSQFALQMVIENAITYSPEGGKVIVSVETRSGFVVVSVRDFGIGISKEDKARLFSKFYRAINAIHAHTEGLGIGLYLSRDIMRRQGGDIWVESAGLGTGSVFFLKFPIKR